MVEELANPVGERGSGTGRLLSVNVGAIREIQLAGTPRTTAIWRSRSPDGSRCGG